MHLLFEKQNIISLNFTQEQILIYVKILGLNYLAPSFGTPTWDLGNLSQVSVENGCGTDILGFQDLGRRKEL